MSFDTDKGIYLHTLSSQVCRNLNAWKAPEVDVPKFNIAIIWTPVFEWCVVRCRSKNKCQKEIRLRAQNMLTLLGAIVNMTGGAYIIN